MLWSSRKCIAWLTHKRKGVRPSSLLCWKGFIPNRYRGAFEESRKSERLDSALFRALGLITSTWSQSRVRKSLEFRKRVIPNILRVRQAYVACRYGSWQEEWKEDIPVTEKRYPVCKALVWLSPLHLDGKWGLSRDQIGPCTTSEKPSQETKHNSNMF